MVTLDWLIIGIFLLIFLCIIGAIFGQDKGQAGETHIYKMLEKLEGRKEILQNCYIPTSNGKTTEVDLILLHESGVYVIESKNYSGWIFGNEEQEKWTQSLRGRYGAQKRHFYNPIWQNKAHIHALMKFLKDSNIPFYSCGIWRPLRAEGCPTNNRNALRDIL